MNLGTGLKSVSNMTPSWVSKYLNFVKDYYTITNNLLDELNTSMPVLVNTILVAILTGDITIGRSFRNMRRLTASVTEDPSVTLLTLKDRDGNIINPTKMTDELQDMYFGMFFDAEAREITKNQSKEYFLW